MALGRVGSMEPARETYPVGVGLCLRNEELKEEEMTHLNAAVRIAKCMNYSDEEHTEIVGLCLDDGSLLLVMIGEKEKYRSVQKLGLYGKQWEPELTVGIGSWW